MIEKGRKLAQERGYYDASKIARNNENGGDRMKIPRGNTGGNYIDVKEAEKQGLTSLKILDEGELDTYTPKDGDDGKPSTKLVVKVSYEGQTDKDPQHWMIELTRKHFLTTFQTFSHFAGVSFTFTVITCGKSENFICEIVTI